MLIERIVELQLRVLGLLAEHVLLKLVIFMKNKNLKGKSSSGLLFTAKMLQETMQPYLPLPADQITYN